MNTMSSSSENEAITIAKEWLENISLASEASDILAFVNLFLPTGWLRDLLCFSWDLRTLSGSSKILTYLSERIGERTRFSKAGLHNFALESSSSIGPPKLFEDTGSPHRKGVEGAFTFSVKSPPAVGRGYFRIFDGVDGWKAFTVLMSLDDFIGHEESVDHPLGISNGPISSSNGYIQENESYVIEKNPGPTVLIIGGGQTGLMCAARFQRLGIRVLVVEKTPRVGDVWRNRYPTLTLHTMAKHCSFLYEPYPENYPKYIPMETLADFIEAYAKRQHINIWLSSTVLPGCKYDPSTCRWSVRINRAGENIVLHPKHLIMANGNTKLNIPKFKGMDSFRGAIYHSDHHRGAHPYRGKKAIVIGTVSDINSPSKGQLSVVQCTSGGDMCLDFVSNGAAEVTLVQRGPTCVASQSAIEKMYLSSYAAEAANLPVEDIDFVGTSMPAALVVQFAVSGGTERLKAMDKNMLEGLSKAGFKLTWKANPNGGEVGPLGFLFEKASAGTLMDVGSSQLIIDGKVKLQGGKIQEIIEDGIVFQNGTKILADVIVMATGYQPLIKNAIDLFGESITEKVGTEIWGIDEEGEPTASYRPTGQAGLWFAFGGFISARFYSKHLGLQILAEELKLKEY